MRIWHFPSFVFFYCTICRLGCNSTWNFVCVRVYVCWFLRPKAGSITRSNFSFYIRVFFTCTTQFDNGIQLHNQFLYSMKKMEYIVIFETCIETCLTISIQFTYVLGNLVFFCFFFFFPTCFPSFCSFCLFPLIHKLFIPQF